MIKVLVLIAFGFANGSEPETCRGYAECHDGLCEIQVSSEAGCEMTLDECLWDSEVWLGNETLTVYGCENKAAPRALSAGWVP